MHIMRISIFVFIIALLGVLFMEANAVAAVNEYPFSLTGTPPLFSMPAAGTANSQKANFLVELTDKETAKEPVIGYSITDYFGKPILESGKADIDTRPMAGYISASVTLPTAIPGWYKVKLSYSDSDGSYRLVNRALPFRVADYFTFAVLPANEMAKTSDSYFGVCEHEVTPENLDAMVKAGIRSLRIDVEWNKIQPAPDEWNWDRMDNLVALTREYGIKLLPIICYSTEFAGNYQENAERRPPQKKYWESFVYKLVSRYKGTIKTWEVWNEPNYSPFWQGTREEYAQMHIQAYRQIKKADPTAVVIPAGTSKVDVDWIKAFYKNGGWTTTDAVAVHPYIMPNPPETSLQPNLSLERQMESEFGTAKQLWITEFGYHTLGDANAVSEKLQAYYAPRSMAIMAGMGAERFFWYELADSRVDSTDKENNFGLLYSDLEPKPSYVSYAVMSSIGTGSRIVRVPYDDKKVRVYSINGGNAEQVLMAWSLYRESRITLDRATPLMVVDMMGRTTTYEPRDGKIEVPFKEEPVYLLNTAPADLNSAIRTSEQSQSPNPLKNGSFELGKTLPEGWEWKVNGGARSTVKYVTAGPGDKAHEGDRYVTLDFQGNKQGNVYSFLSTQLKVQPFTAYRISFWVRTKQVEEAWVGGGPGWVTRIPVPRDTGGKWVRVEGTFNTWNDKLWQLMVLIENQGDRLDIDDITVDETR